MKPLTFRNKKTGQVKQIQKKQLPKYLPNPRKTAMRRSGRKV